MADRARQHEKEQRLLLSSWQQINLSYLTGRVTNSTGVERVRSPASSWLAQQRERAQVRTSSRALLAFSQRLIAGRHLTHRDNELYTTAWETLEREERFRSLAFVLSTIFDPP